MTRQGLQRPMLFRIKRKDGSSFVCEATANAQMSDPDIGGLVAYLRRWDERHLMDLVIEQLAGGAPLQDTLGLLVEVMGAETLEADGAILIEPFAGRFFRVVGSPQLPPELLADAGPGGHPLAPGQPDRPASGRARVASCASPSHGWPAPPGTSGVGPSR